MMSTDFLVCINRSTWNDGSEVGPVKCPWISQTTPLNFSWNLAYFQSSIVKSRTFPRELGWSLAMRFIVLKLSTLLFEKLRKFKCTRIYYT